MKITVMTSCDHLGMLCALLCSEYIVKHFESSVVLSKGLHLQIVILQVA